MILFIFFFIVLTAFSSIITGCSKAVEVKNEDVPSPGIYRMIEKDGAIVTVTLNVVLPDGALFYFFEENLPENAELISSEVEQSGNSLKHIVFSGAESTAFKYSIKAEKGVVFFSGEYAIDGMDEPEQIKGVSEITI